jgi:ketosteroid isomerase-like protein
MVIARVSAAARADAMAACKGAHASLAEGFVEARDATTEAPGELADVAARFTAAWAAPAVDRFVAMLAPDVRLLQPVTPTVVGRDAARREFARLLHWLPDLRGVVDAWSASGCTLLVAWRLGFTLGRGPFELRIVDRIVVRQGLIVEREAYFDSLRFLLAVLVRPGTWWGYARYRGYLPGGLPESAP